MIANVGQLCIQACNILVRSLAADVYQLPRKLSGGETSNNWKFDSQHKLISHNTRNVYANVDKAEHNSSLQNYIDGTTHGENTLFF